jgi:hypothetical protein
MRRGGGGSDSRRRGGVRVGERMGWVVVVAVMVVRQEGEGQLEPERSCDRLGGFFHGNIGIVHIEHWPFGFVQIFWGSVVVVGLVVDDEGFLQIPFGCV